MLNEKDSFLLDKVFSMEKSFQDRSTVVVKSHHAKTKWYKNCHGLEWLYFVTHLYATFVGGCF